MIDELAGKRAMNDTVQISWAGELCTITINRPEKANSLSGTMLEALVKAVDASSTTAKAMIITGQGSVFSAGADLEEARAGLATSDLWEQLSTAIAGAHCLTIAALNGTVAGGAFGMVLACDLRVSVPTAKFFYPVMKLGFLPQPSDPGRLTALVGRARAKMILMAGQKVKADDAMIWGLVDMLVPQEALLKAATELAQDTLAADRNHVAVIKSMIDSNHDRLGR